MHLERGIVRTHRWSDVLYPLPEDQITLTCQFANTNGALREPLIGAVIWNLARIRPYSMLRLRLHLRLRPSASLPPS